MFTLDQRLIDDTVLLGSLPLSELLLMNDANYPWLILVPRVDDAVEVIDLSPAAQATLLDEVNLVSRVLRSTFNAEKLNVAQLGNIVRQLHVHCIARYETDKAWPGPIWGRVPVQPYDADDLDRRCERTVDGVKADGALAFTSHRSYS